MMDRLQRSYYRLKAQGRFREDKRQVFQAWIGKAFELAHLRDYDDIRLTQGDGGLDGIIVSESAVVAVYAPRTMTESDLIKKIKSDFATASQTMADQNAKMKKFILVHNDEGQTKETGPAVFKLNQENPGTTIQVWKFEALWAMIEGLSFDQKMDLLGEAPSELMMDTLEMPAIRNVVNELNKVPVEPKLVEDITIPDPKKLEFNDLSLDNQNVLVAGRQKHGYVEDFLSNLPDLRDADRIAKGFSRKYADCRDAGMSSDVIFNELWAFAGGHHFTTAIDHAAVTAVLSHFFHICTIFENVPES